VASWWQKRQERRETLRQFDRARGWASGFLKFAVGDEPVISQGTLYMHHQDGKSTSYNYRLTGTRLLWNSAEAPEVDGFGLTDVVSRRCWDDENGLARMRVEVGNRTLEVSILPLDAGFVGPRLKPHQRWVTRLILLHDEMRNTP
jgi:hypothetical protein